MNAFLKRSFCVCASVAMCTLEQLTVWRSEDSIWGPGMESDSQG